MNKDRIFDDIFIALLVVLFLSIYNFFFYFFESFLEIKSLIQIFYIWGLVMIIIPFVIVKPSIINLKDKKIIDYLCKIWVISLIVFFILLFTFLFIWSCRHGDFQGIEACRTNTLQSAGATPF